MSAQITQERLMKILLAPHMSEKSSMVQERDRQYVFKVIKDATKPEIGRAVELLFNVKVEAVRVSNVKSKVKRFGRTEGRRQGWKKAYVKLAEGQMIEFHGAQA